MAEKPTADDALRELRLLATCRCAPDWTERDLHDSHCVAYYRDEVDTVAEEIAHLRAVADAARATLDITGLNDALQKRAALRTALAALDGTEPAPPEPPADSCSTCGAEPGEQCRYGCAYQASRRDRGWKELPTPTVLSVQVLEEIEAIRHEMPDDI